MAKNLITVFNLILNFFNLGAVPTHLPPETSPSYQIQTFARGLKAPRDLVWDGTGYLLASVPTAGRVVAVSPSGQTSTVVEGLNRPHGLAFYKDRLYIAESHQVAWYAYDSVTHSATNKHKIADLPNGGMHFTRSILFADGQLLISVGSDCNACAEADWRRAKILTTSPDGGHLTEFAEGLRNSVFMTTHPTTGEVWATEMGQDFLGDDLPPDEINILKQGSDYGWPKSYGSSRIDLPAHVAPLGLAFLNENELLVALHGSWNSTVPVGYKIVKVNLATGEISDFWTTGIQRPVDILIHSKTQDIYISDDKSGNIYKLSLTPPPLPS